MTIAEDRLPSKSQLQNQMLYAPFIKQRDKLDKDPAELSLTDFEPQRFAVNYEPPIIILEYMVPTTGKLYHHKMKLRQIKASSKVEDQLKYLRKRHPLYFDVRKINEDQITDLIKKIIFRLKANQPDVVSESEDKKNDAPPAKEEPEPPKKSKIPMKTKSTFQSLTKQNDEQKSSQSDPKSPVFSNGGNLPKIMDKLNKNTHSPPVMLDDVQFAIQDDFQIGKEQPLSNDFNKVTKISTQMYGNYDGCFDVDDEEEDSDAYIENEVAKIANGLKTQIDDRNYNDNCSDDQYFDDEFDDDFD